jgi:hypothetical protein
MFHQLHAASPLSHSLWAPGYCLQVFDFGWLLFLVAKQRLLPAFPDLVSSCTVLVRPTALHSLCPLAPY